MSKKKRGTQASPPCGSSWFAEKLYPDYVQAFKVRKTLVAKKTKFQDMRLFETSRFGRVLVLDGVIQTTTADEYIYHEMMVHIPMLTQANPKRVLIVGAGDGGILREVLKYKVKKVVVAEIDEDVITFAKKYLRSICKNAFNDKRTQVLVCDGARYVAETKERFDVVIVDSPDPVGPAKVLFSKEFYENIFKILSKDGIMVRQSGAPFFQRGELASVSSTLKKVFKKSFCYVLAIPTYVGGFFSISGGTKGKDPKRLLPQILRKRYKTFKLKTKYYNPDVHYASFALPNNIKALAGEGGR